MDVAEPELVKLGRLRFQVGKIALVGQEYHRLVDAPQTLGDFLIERHRTRANVNDEKHDLSAIDAGLNLVFDFLGKVLRIFDADAAGIDDLEIAFALTPIPSPSGRGVGVRAGLGERIEPITRDAGRGIDDGDAPARQPVEERRFADIGPADDGYLRYGHAMVSKNARVEAWTAVV